VFVRLFAWNNSAPIGRIFIKFDIWRFFEFVEKIQLLLKSDKKNGYLREDLCIFMIISRPFRVTMRHVSDKVVEKIKTHILCSITFSRKSCRFLDNVAKYGRRKQATDDNITRLMRFLSWITNMKYLLLFHGNNCYANASHCYVIRTLPVFCMLKYTTNYTWEWFIRRQSVFYGVAVFATTGSCKPKRM
jgi:hypothetical protein